jgi:SNW domain-containing protein 1
MCAAEDPTLPPPPPKRPSGDLPPRPGLSSNDLPHLPGPPAGGDREHLSQEELAAKRARDELRKERQQERERELRLEEKNRAGSKRSKLTRDRDRDVSEKMALGQADVGRTREVQYDSRLFNKEAGIGSGFTGDETYNFYDKELFADRSAMAMYRSRDVRDSDVYGGAASGATTVPPKKFAPDKGFAGTDAVRSERTGPVQFERAAGKASHADAEADPFGIDSFLGGVSKR